MKHKPQSQVWSASAVSMLAAGMSIRAIAYRQHVTMAAQNQ